MSSKLTIMYQPKNEPVPVTHYDDLAIGDLFTIVEPGAAEHDRSLVADHGVWIKTVNGDTSIGGQVSPAERDNKQVWRVHATFTIDSVEGR